MKQFWKVAMKSIILVLALGMVACAPIPIKNYKSDVVNQRPCYETNSCPMQNPPTFLFYNNFNHATGRK